MRTATAERQTYNPSIVPGADRMVARSDNKPPSALGDADILIPDLGQFLKDHPVIQTAAESRSAKAMHDRAVATGKSIEDERTALLAPLREKVEGINGRYKPVYNTDNKRPGTLNKIIDQLKFRLTGFALAEEEKRRAEAERLAAEAAEAERLAREAEAAERETIEDAAAGVCDADVAGATVEADEAFAEFKRADRFAARAERDAKVRIGGGFSGRVLSLRTHEVLQVESKQAAIAAIEEMGLTDDVREAIIKSARVYRKNFGELPEGVTATQERSV